MRDLFPIRIKDGIRRVALTQRGCTAASKGRTEYPLSKSHPRRVMNPELEGRRVASLHNEQAPGIRRRPHSWRVPSTVHLVDDSESKVTNGPDLHWASGHPC